MAQGSDIWETLGIAPAAETAIVRRAYVARLRTIDVDRDPAAFIRLREAYELALTICASPTPEVSDALPFAEIPLPETAAIPDDDSRDGLIDRWESGETDGSHNHFFERMTGPEEFAQPKDVVEAWHAYNSVMANGLVGLGQQRALALQLVTAALEDKALPMPMFLEIAAVLGPEVPGRPEYDESLIREAIKARIAAHRWLETVEASADRRASTKSKYVVRAAQILLGRRQKIRRNRREIDAVAALLDEYYRHAEWLGNRLDHERIASLEKRLQSRDPIGVLAKRGVGAQKISTGLPNDLRSQAVDSPKPWKIPKINQIISLNLNESVVLYIILFVNPFLFMFFTSCVVDFSGNEDSFGFLASLPRWVAIIFTTFFGTITLSSGISAVWVLMYRDARREIFVEWFSWLVVPAVCFVLFDGPAILVRDAFNVGWGSAILFIVGVAFVFGGVLRIILSP